MQLLETPVREVCGARVMRTRTKDAILPDITHELVSFHRHGARCLPSGFFTIGVVELESYSTGNDVSTDADDRRRGYIESFKQESVCIV
jgi:hypothetical protein